MEIISIENRSRMVAIEADTMSIIFASYIVYGLQAVGASALTFSFSPVLVLSEYLSCLRQSYS